MTLQSNEEENLHKKSQRWDTFTGGTFSTLCGGEKNAGFLKSKSIMLLLVVVGLTHGKILCVQILVLSLGVRIVHIMNVKSPATCLSFRSV